MLKAGAAEAAIHFQKEMFPTPVENYTGIHDDPYAHAVCLEQAGQGEKERFVILSLDLVNYPDPGELRDLASGLTGADKKNILVHCSHTLSTPHAAFRISSQADALYDRTYRESVKNAAGQALAGAAASIRPVKAGFGSAVSNVNVNRVIRLQEGLWQGTNEGGISDHTVPVICFSDAESGQPVAILYAVNMAAGILEGSRSADGGRLVSADIAGTSERYLKETYPGAVCIYCIGASGDQWQELRAVSDRLTADGKPEMTDRHEEGFVYCDALGRKLASSVTAAMQELETEDTEAVIKAETADFVYDGQKELGRDLHAMQPGRNIVFEHAGEVHSDVTVVTIGQIAVVAAHPEICVRTLMNIRAGVPDRKIFFMEFTNGDGGYMAEREIYDGCGYQSRKSRFYSGSAEKFERNAIALLKKSGRQEKQRRQKDA